MTTADLIRTNWNLFVERGENPWSASNKHDIEIHRAALGLHCMLLQKLRKESDVIADEIYAMAGSLEPKERGYVREFVDYKSKEWVIQTVVDGKVVKEERLPASEYVLNKQE